MNQILGKSKKESCMDNLRTDNREYTVNWKKCIYYEKKMYLLCGYGV